MVGLCGLSEECFESCQLNSHVLYGTHSTAVYSRMWCSWDIRMRADFKLDPALLKGVCKVTPGYWCELCEPLNDGRSAVRALRGEAFSQSVGDNGRS